MDERRHTWLGPFADGSRLVDPTQRNSPGAPSYTGPVQLCNHLLLEFISGASSLQSFSTQFVAQAQKQRCETLAM